ncbi:MAG: bifunctional phosphoribosylaminoimidazolecarboxamide formyltransferase/IMP cyclohydrolase [Candidatus Fischerbacteria bacterium RBG_13_37_8]|uniref:Bifunctional purine biosynthesis protein PurH n=1 Tax=Candidatus Fischerbacteria bacterium RBG_13_37_8 TaxID=1817863 RepID=A0A1F5V4N7_9BACT|nr:MAG: bifunctional phosphoribosylaminoimidazolecarboxamide formyltransferase/IMP cyclohydrolase [Candidatus Fischerbacteria bacterium RBG_13_37_8]
MIKRVLISVFDKKDIEKLCQALMEKGVEIWASGGTAAFLKNNGIRVRELEEITGFSNMLQGRVKTLHPMVFAGILADSNKEQHQKDIEQYKIPKFDMVVVNLYPFEEKVIKGDLPIEEAVEWIDIGGSALIRASAKNYNNITILIQPEDYPAIIDFIKEGKEIPLGYKQNLAGKAFQFSSYYDALISNYFLQESEQMPLYLTLPLKKEAELRYGENPHQRACAYKDISLWEKGILSAEQLHGKEMSFNNYIDVQAAFDIVGDLTGHACAIIKHTNPCGAAWSDNALTSFKIARETDPEAAFGSIVAFNCEVDEATAQEVSCLFVECLIAPSYSEEALTLLKSKKNLRILLLDSEKLPAREWDLRRIKGGILLQDYDNLLSKEWNIVTKRQPNDYERKALTFAWTVVKHVKSNAIVFTTDHNTIGIGAGQMSRVDSVRLAKSKARSSLKDSVIASDAFFPFKDNVEEIAKAGATAIIQPGGSIRDQEVIEEADRQNIAMVFTGVRHFKH